jgi:hypothetical protein
MLAAARDDAGPLLGRDAELETLTSLLDGIERGGGALVLRGEPGDRIFPKLGITARGELGAALSAGAARPQR